MTAYAVRAVADRAALLAVEPKSGRTHQIRVHAAHAGCALYGDPTYGGPAKMVSSTGSVTALGRIALHAAWVEVPGEKGEALRVEAQLPEDFAAIWVACGGVASELERALPPLTPE